MVFSFFKKQPQKMPERPAARPRPPVSSAHSELVSQKPDADEAKPLVEPLPDLEFTSANIAQSTSKSPPATTTIKSEALAEVAPPPLDFGESGFGDDFTESSVMGINVDFGGDPVQSDVEHVVVLFANGQDVAARAQLELFVKMYPGAEGQRFWVLLFDLLQAVGDRPAFEALGETFSAQYEISPPTWRAAKKATSKQAEQASTIFALQGVLTVDDAKPLAELAKLIGLKKPVTVDCGKLIGCDDEIAGDLADLLQQARRSELPVTLENTEGLILRLSERLVVGDADHLPAWLLLLELLQRNGTQDKFEEKAVDYAVSFDISPPSWEVAVTAGRKSKSTVRTAPVVDDAHYLSGDLVDCRFEDLDEFIKEHELPVIDFSGVRRLDFFSAGQLVNRLVPHKNRGVEILIRSPNHLVAELMAVVGLSKQARIIVPKT